ncbi:MAG: acyl-CoA dehydrogenase family protein [Myxococcota bacterium]
MNFAFTEEQEELRATARAFLADQSSPVHVRAAMETELGHDAAVWKQIGAELGWTAVAIPEAYGGLGLSWVEVVALQELMGEALFCSPYFATVCLAAPAIEAAGDEAQKERLLASLAGEGAVAALASGGGVRFRREGDGYRLDGAVRGVVDGHCADLLVVAARPADAADEDPVTLFAVPATTQGVERTALPTLDRTRRLAELRFVRASVPESARLGAEGSGGPPLEHALALGAIALAGELVGVAQRSLDLSVAYAKERVQFGRPIGSFQAIKHKCADMMVKCEAARSATYWAACTASASDGEALALAASAAKAAAGGAAFFCTGCALQIFGGVGFTAEYDIHLYFKRARAGAALLGDAAFHREQVARRIGLGP